VTEDHFEIRLCDLLDVDGIISFSATSLQLRVKNKVSNLPGISTVNQGKLDTLK
jgi:hypothetical protein